MGIVLISLGFTIIRGWGPMFSLLSLKALQWNPKCCFPAVRHIIRNIKTGGYFRGGAWVTGRDDAQDFGDTARVIAASIDHKLEGIEMVIQVSDKPCPEKDVVLRISPWWKQGREPEKQTGQFRRASS